MQERLNIQKMLIKVGIDEQPLISDKQPVENISGKIDDFRERSKHFQKIGRDYSF